MTGPPYPWKFKVKMGEIDGKPVYMEWVSWHWIPDPRRKKA